MVYVNTLKPASAAGVSNTYDFTPDAHLKSEIDGKHITAITYYGNQSPMQQYYIVEGVYDAKTNKITEASFYREERNYGLTNMCVEPLSNGGIFVSGFSLADGVFKTAASPIELKTFNPIFGSGE